MRESAIQVRTPSGVEVVVTLHPYVGAAPRLTASLPAKGISGGTSEPRPLPETADTAAFRRAGATHYINVGPKCISVGLAETEARKVLDALETHKAAYRNSAEGRREALIEERQVLDARLRGIGERMDAASEVAHEEDMGQFGEAHALQDEWAAARAALTAFDAAHPTIRTHTEIHTDDFREEI